MSTQPSDGGLAFPVSYMTTSNGEFLHGHRGMSLRAYFAGQVLNGLYANANLQLSISGNLVLEGRAKFALEQADALIAELNKTQQ